MPDDIPPTQPTRSTLTEVLRGTAILVDRARPLPLIEARAENTITGWEVIATAPDIATARGIAGRWGLTAHHIEACRQAWSGTVPIVGMRLRVRVQAHDTGTGRPARARGTALIEAAARDEHLAGAR